MQIATKHAPANRQIATAVCIDMTVQLKIPLTVSEIMFAPFADLSAIYFASANRL